MHSNVKSPIKVYMKKYTHNQQCPLQYQSSQYESLKGPPKESQAKELSDGVPHHVRHDEDIQLPWLSIQSSLERILSASSPSRIK